MKINLIIFLFQIILVELQDSDEIAKKIINIILEIFKSVNNIGNDPSINTCYQDIYSYFNIFNNTKIKSFFDLYFNTFLMTGILTSDLNKEYECLRDNKMIYFLVEIKVDEDIDHLAYFRQSNTQFREYCIVRNCDYFLKNAYKCNIFGYVYDKVKFCKNIDKYIINPLKNNYPFFLNYKFLSIVYIDDNKKIYIDEE